MLRLILGSSVRKKEWLELQRANSSFFEESLILGHNIEGGDITLCQDGHISSTCRNTVIREFLKTDATHLVWIDEDLSLKNDDYFKLVEFVGKNPDVIGYGQRIFKNVADQRLSFKPNTEINHNHAFSCFMVIPRSVLEKELDEDWFPLWFDKNWGFEDITFAYKFKILFGVKLMSMEAVVYSVAPENNIKGYENSQQIDMLDPLKRKQSINQRKWAHFWRVIEYAKEHGYYKGFIPKNTYLKFT